MPFRSEVQRRFMYAVHPDLAREFEAATPPGARLPQHVQKGKPVASNFDKLAAKLSQRPGVTNPKGLAYAIGAKKFGAARMSRAAAAGKPAAKVK